MTDHPPPLRVVVGVGVVAGTTLALQVLLTRLLSAVFLYHFAFLAISLALLGTGGGALLVYVRERRGDAGPVEPLLARYGIAFAVFLLVLPIVLSNLHYAAGGLAHGLTGSFVFTLSLACLAAAVPFLAAGIVIALAITRYVRWVGRVYAFDLCGAALGAITIVPLLWLLDAPAIAVGLCAVAALAATMFGWQEQRVRLASLALAAVGLALAALAQSGSQFQLPISAFPIGGTRPVAVRWTPLSRVIGFAPASARVAGITYDRDGAPVPLYRRGQPPLNWRALGLGPQSIPYTLTPPGKTLVIGGGGGRDIHNALSSGQSSVDVIELNRGIVDVVDRDLRRWSGGPYSLHGVHTAVGDGRSTLAARSTKYQHINIGFTNTLGTSAGSSYALAEANLYTVEAFDEYFDHLLPGGTLSVTRLYRFSGDADVVNVLTNVCAPDGAAVFERVERRGPSSHPNSGDVVAYTYPRFALQNGAGPLFTPTTTLGQHGGLNTHPEFHTTLGASGLGITPQRIDVLQQTDVARFVRELMFGP